MLSGAAALLADGNADGGRSAAPTLAKLLRNALSSPLEPKFRRLRLANSFVRSAVDARGGLELLEEAGFLVVVEAGAEGVDEVFAILPLQEEESEHEAQMAAVAAALASLAPLLPAQPPPAPPPMDAPPPGGRRTRVFRSELCLAALSDLPPEYFQRSAEELKQDALQRRAALEASQQLMTRAMRSKPDGAASARETCIRVRLPDGLLLQGAFGALEKVSAVREWLAACLAEPHRAFSLRPPPGGGSGELVDAADLRACGLVPSALLSFSWGPEESVEKGSPMLREELARAAEALE
jgi:UBX domain-containing protein 6